VAHLGDRVAALVDGQLPADVVDRAHAHLVGCRPCREAVEAERLMKGRLACLRGPEPGVDLMQRLLAMGGPNGPLPPRGGHVPGTPRPQPVALPRAFAAPPLTPAGFGVGSPTHEAADPFGVASLTSVAVLTEPGERVGFVADRPAGRRPARQVPRGGSTGPGRLRPRRRTRLAVAAVFGALSVVGVGVSSLAVSGGVSPSMPTVVPPVDTFVVDHAETTRELPFVDVPAGWQLTQARQDGGAGR
jgi:hypothetical protein